MLIIEDCGCSEHPSQPVTFDGVQGALMERFIANLPINGLNFTYICEAGYPHRVIPHFPQENRRAVEYGELDRQTLPFRVV